MSMATGRWVFPLIVVVLLVYLASQTLLGDGGRDRIAYSDLITRVEDSPQSIDDVLFLPMSQGIRITLNDGSMRESNYPTDGAQLEFQHLLEERNVHFDAKGKSDSGWWSILTYLLPFLLFFGFWIFLMRNVRQGKRGGNASGSSLEPAEG